MGHLAPKHVLHCVTQVTGQYLLSWVREPELLPLQVLVHPSISHEFAARGKDESAYYKWQWFWSDDNSLMTEEHQQRIKLPGIDQAVRHLFFRSLLSQVVGRLYKTSLRPAQLMK